MRCKERNYDDFCDAIVREVVDTSYTNEHAARLLVEILMAVDDNRCYIEDGPDDS